MPTTADGVPSTTDPNSPATTTGLVNSTAPQESLQQQIDAAWAAYQANPALANKVTQMDPQYAWMLSNPELAPIIIAAAQNSWDSNRIQAALEPTQWWKSNGQAARQWQSLQATDPATAAQQVAIQKNTIIQQANALGVQLADGDITNLATMSAEFGWDSNTIQQAVAQAYKPATAPTGGTAADFSDQAKQLVGEYAVPIGDDAMQHWTQQAVMGKANIAGFEDYLRGQAQTLYPFMQTALSNGITPKNWFAPYTAQAQSILGLSPDQVKWSDPKWLDAVTAMDQGGQRNPVNLTTFANNLRSNAGFGYQYTQDAKNNAYTLASTVAKTFGKLAG